MRGWVPRGYLLPYNGVREELVLVEILDGVGRECLAYFDADGLDYVLQTWRSGRKVAQALQNVRHADAVDHRVCIRTRRLLVMGLPGLRHSVRGTRFAPSQERHTSLRVAY